jgi:hypothetical protein
MIDMQNAEARGGGGGTFHGTIRAAVSKIVALHSTQLKVQPAKFRAQDERKQRVLA